jgi:hypothetical protein
MAVASTAPVAPTLPQTVVLLALAEGKQPWIAPAIRTTLARRGWIAESGTRSVSGATTAKTRDGRPARTRRDIPTWSLTELGRRALAMSAHIDVARLQVRNGAQKDPWS